MKLLVFGATGGTGKQLVRQALQQGHHVTAFVRDPSRFTETHPSLQLMTGDVLQPAEVQKAITGQDAVLISLGAPPKKASHVRSQGTLNIMEAMKKTGVSRLVCQTSLGYGDSKEVLLRTPFIFRHIIQPLLLKEVFADHEKQEEYIKNSRLDWVVVRPANLTNGELTRTYQSGFAADDKTIRAKISRADVADFMLQQISGNRFLRQTPGISY